MQTRFADITLRAGHMAIGIIALFSLVPMASASAIGNFNEANCSGGGVTVTLTSITWATVGTPPVPGCIATGLGSSMTYSGGTLGAGFVGTILNLVTPGPPSVDKFITFQGTTLDFVLNGFVIPGTTNGVNCAGTTSGQTCVAVAGSPFLLTNAGNTTSVSLTAFGTIVDGGITSNWTGLFTTQLTASPGSVQSTELGGGSIASTQSGQFTVSAVPEPASFTMMIGAGLVAFAMALKRLKRA